MKIRHFLFLFLIFIYSSCQNANLELERNPPLMPIDTVYVSPDGSDESGLGTLEKPIKTLAYAAENLDVLSSASIVLAEGEYVENKQIIIPPEVSVRGAGVGNTIVKSELSDQFLIVLESDSGSVGAQSISDFTIDGTNRSLYGGLWIEGRSDVKIQNMEFKNIDIMGAVIIDDRLKIIPDAGEWATGIQVLDCRFENTSADLQTYSTGGLNIGGLDGAIIRNIEIIEDEGYGIKFYKDGYLKNTVIEDCTITVPESDTLWGEDIAIELWNLYEGNRISRVTANTWISLVNQDFFSPDPDAVNILLEDSHIESIGNSSQKEGVELAAKGAVIRNNYISGKGFGIALWAAVKENVLIEGNIIRHMNSPSSAWNGGAGIFIANSKAYDFSNITIMHNVIDETATGIWFKQETIASTMDGLNVFNNYFGNIASNAVRVTGAIVDLTLKNNFLDDGAGASTLLSIDAGANIVTEVETGNLEGTPDFTSVGDFWDSYYKPESDSLLIDAGFDTGLRTFSGAGPDIGAFEIQ